SRIQNYTIHGLYVLKTHMGILPSLNKKRTSAFFPKMLLGVFKIRVRLRHWGAWRLGWEHSSIGRDVAGLSTATSRPVVNKGGLGDPIFVDWALKQELGNGTVNGIANMQRCIRSFMEICCNSSRVVHKTVHMADRTH